MAGSVRERCSAGARSVQRPVHLFSPPRCWHVPRPQAAPVFDKIVFSKIKEKLGGRVKLVVSGEQRPPARTGLAPAPATTVPARFP